MVIAYGGVYGARNCDHRTPSTVGHICAEMVGRGFKHIKLHEIGVDEVKAAREGAGPDVALMNDVNCPWSVSQAMEMERAFRPCNLTWLEEPVWPPEDHVGLARVRAAGATRIAAGENAAGLHDFVDLFQKGAIDIAQPSATKIEADVTNASRRMKKVEFETCQKNGVTDIIELNIGFDGVTIPQSKAGQSIKLTLAQVYLALAQQVPDKDAKLVDNPYKTWSDIRNQSERACEDDRSEGECSLRPSPLGSCKYPKHERPEDQGATENNECCGNGIRIGAPAPPASRWSSHGSPCLHP